MEENIYKIYYDAPLMAVVMQWNGYATSEQFRKGTELMLDLVIRHNTPRVLADIREMVIIGMEDQHWLEGNFLPRAIEMGFTALAIVKPVSYFNKVAVESISYKVDKEKLSINFFDNREEATHWLLSQA